MIPKPSNNDELLNKINQFLLALYLSNFAFSRIMIKVLPINSFLIVLVSALLIIIISQVLNYKNRILRRSPLVIISCTILFLFIHIIIYGNPVVYIYFYDFLIFGALPLLLLMRISRLDWFFKYMAYLSIPIICLLGFDPINKYAITSNYMVYGYAVMLPSFMGLFIARKLFGMKWTFPFEIIAFLLLVFYANQGATLSALATIIMYKVCVETINKKTLLLNLSILFVIIFSLINLRSILEMGIEFTKSNGTYSYAFEKTYGSVYGNTDGLSGRGLYWNKAVQMFGESPIFGSGIGSFESKFGIYTHNIFLEAAVSIGFFGLIFLIIYLFVYLYQAIKTERVNRLLYVLGISIGLIPLLFSMQPFMWCYFWVFTLNPRHNIFNSKRNFKKIGDINE